jgi:phage terminase large subunit-like protein
MAPDPVSAYARGVVEGSIVAGSLVVAACRRHLADVAEGSRRGLIWRPDQAARAIAFFAEILVLPESSEAAEAVTAARDPTEPRPFVLAPWQAFIVGSLFGWYTVQGFRRYREAYIETAKGSGKTPLGAGIMLYLLVADGQRGAQVYLAAVTREQAGLAWRDCRKMVEDSPELRAFFGADGLRAHELIVPGDGAFLKPISSERRGLDGKRVHGALVDELHEHGTSVVVDKVRAGTKGNRNALIVKTTNSGFDRMSVCWFHHEYSRKVLEGTLDNDSWFAYVCGLDPCDACRGKGRWFPSDDCAQCDDWRVEGPAWLKANPNLGISLPWQYVRERVRQAEGMPTQISDVLRFNFCVWTQGIQRAFDMGRWAACKPMPTDAELSKALAFGCLDYGQTDDLTAWGRLWVLEDGRLAVKMHYFACEDALTRFPARPYDAWRRAGLLTVTSGASTDYATVQARIRADVASSKLQAVYFDPATAKETGQVLTGDGILMVEIRQGFALNEAIRRLETLITSADLCHGGDPVLAWMASNTVIVTGTRGEKRLAKERSPEKIDGIAALVSGIEGALVRRERHTDPFIEVYGGR